MASSKRHIIHVTYCYQPGSQPGLLQRIAGLFGRFCINIESAAAVVLADQDVVKLTIVVKVEERLGLRLTKIIQRLIGVISVEAFHADRIITRELMLIHVCAKPELLREIQCVVEVFRARIIEMTAHSLIVEAVGDELKLDALIQLLKPYGINQIARTGAVALHSCRVDHNEGTG